MKRFTWGQLTSDEKADAIARPPQLSSAQLVDGVDRIIEQVRADGDVALQALTRRYDGVELSSIAVDRSLLAQCDTDLDPQVSQAIDVAADNIRKFHQATLPLDAAVDTMPGVRCERLNRPLRTVGLYVPAGSAPLPSTVLMLAIPAQLAGCTRVVLCSPPGADGQIEATTLAAAHRFGVDEVFRVGGAQAIAAMAYGTETVPRCDKIFGPGNAWVTQAKQRVSQDPAGAAIDMPAGPSEVLVLADAQANAEFVAADLLSQAEHGTDSQVVLVCDSAPLADAVEEQVRQQMQGLSRNEICQGAWAHARIIVTESIDQAFDVSNRYAPEHLIIHVAQARTWLPKVQSAGSVFLGPWSPESMGDYCSGTNHVLPTYGYARTYSGVSVASFQTAMTVQELSADGLRSLGPVAQVLAQAEGLDAHEQAVSRRLTALESSA